MPDSDGRTRAQPVCRIRGSSARDQPHRRHRPDEQSGQPPAQGPGRAVARGRPVDLQRQHHRPLTAARPRVGRSAREADSGVRHSSTGQRILRASRHSGTSGEMAVGRPTARSIGRSE